MDGMDKSANFTLTSDWSQQKCPVKAQLRSANAPIRSDLLCAREINAAQPNLERETNKPYGSKHNLVLFYLDLLKSPGKKKHPKMFFFFNVENGKSP